MRFFLLAYYVLAAIGLWSQSLPNQVYVFRLEANASTNMVVHSPKLLTQFNATGYNNQPFFKNENELLLTVQLKGSPQTDIYSFNLSTNTKTQITHTSLSEYSPTVSRDEKYLTCVRVDDPGTALQRLYEYELTANGSQRSLLPDIKNVGYHAWLDDKSVALFLVNKPNQIALVNIDSKDPLIFSSDIGRCLAKNANGNLLYVHKLTDDYWYIKEYDPINQRAAIVAETLPKAEDFAIAPGGKLIMGKDSKLFIMDPGGADKAWKEIADLKYFGIHNIKRIAVKGSRIAIVDQR